MRHTEFIPARKGKADRNEPILEDDRDESDSYEMTDGTPKSDRKQEIDNHNSGGFSNAASL
jgi:hypothetical protein